MTIALRWTAACAVFATFGVAHAGTWTIQALDSLGLDSPTAAGINNSGQIVGYGFDLSGNSRAVLWSSNGSGVELTALSATPHAEAYRINSSGQIVGLSRAANGESHAVVWNAGSPTDLGTLGGTFSFANDINDSGVVVGSAYIAGGGSHAFSWTQGGGMVDYGSFNNTDRNYYAGFNGINNSGFKVGTGYRLFSPYHAAWAQPGATSITDLAVPGQFSTSMAMAVNDAGVVVGYSNNGSGNPQAVIWTAPGAYIGLGSLGLGESRAFDVNENGDIVGDAMGEVDGNFVQKAFLYRNGQMQDLLGLLTPGSGWSSLVVANGVNDSGQIVGYGIYNGAPTAFVMTEAVPEPATIAALALGGLALVRKRHKKA